MNISDDQDLKKEIQSLESEYGLQFKQSTVNAERFSGEDSVILLVAFVLNGFVQGLLSKIGSDFWDKLKNVIIKIFDKNKEHPVITTIKIITYRNDHEVSITCKIKSIEELYKLISCSTKTEKLLKLIKENESLPDGEYPMKIEGDWKHNESKKQ